jgi:hypothetical protein
LIPADDINTRLTLLERTTVSRDDLTAREDRLLERFEAIMDRYVDRMSEDQEHRFKLFGHEIADQLRLWADKIHAERNAIDAKREASLTPQPASVQYRSFMSRNWAWFGAIAMIIVLLRPDLAGAVARLFM